MSKSDFEKKQKGCSCRCAGQAGEFAKRVRGLTAMSLEWLAERIKKAETIKEKLAQGTYKVDSDKLAKAILNEESKKK